MKKVGRPRIHTSPLGVYGRLTTLKEIKGTKYSRRFLCSCSCGKEKVVSLNSLLSGNTKSCGCLKKDLLKTTKKTHGLSRHRLYRVWHGIKQRCLYEKHIGYKNYGGRGISVCKKWMTFEPFYRWAISTGYRKGLTIERVDNNGDYEPSNCTWIHRKDQVNNRRGLHLIFFNGEERTLSSWARKIGITQSSLRHRLNNGWSISEALTIKKHGKKAKDFKKKG